MVKMITRKFKKNGHIVNVRVNVSDHHEFGKPRNYDRHFLARGDGHYSKYKFAHEELSVAVNEVFKIIEKAIKYESVHDERM